LYARKVVLAMGREGSGAARWPAFETFNPEKPRPNVFHSAEDLDFSLFKNKKIAVLGAGASAFDNAACFLEAGAKQVTMFSRRREVRQGNKSKWSSFPGFFHGFSARDAIRRWRFTTYIFGEQVPPPYESVLRVQKFREFELKFGEKWRDIVPGKS